MKAIHGGKAKHEKIDAHKIAVLLHGGMRPQADVDPAAMRATRDLLRRRMYLTRQRAERLAHIQHTKSQYHWPEMGQKLADKANRDGVAARFPDPAAPQSLEVDLALLGSYDHRLGDVELHLVKAATQHHAQTRSRLQTGPGSGTILRRVLLYESHDLQRFPRVQEFIAYGRLVKCATASAGTRYGTSGTKIGNASLKGAFSDAAVLCLRAHPAGQQDRARLENKHGTGKALTGLAQKLARAVYDLLRRGTGFTMDTFLHGSGRGAGEPAASLGHDGWSLTTVLGHEAPRASTNAQEHRGPLP
jgi:transposase